MTGTYYVVVKTGGPFQFIYTNGNIGIGNQVTVSLSSPPDLTPTKVESITPDSTAELTTANAGDTIDVTWTVQNVGPGAANGVWYDALTMKEVGGPQTYNLGLFGNTGPLQAGLSYTRTEQVTLPKHIQGIFQLVLQTNHGPAPIFEDGLTANETLVDPDTLTVTLPANPNLQVFSVDAPQSANAGGTLGIDFTVINQGTVEAPGHWQDAVYLSFKNTLDGSAILLGTFNNQSALLPGQEYQTQTGDMLIPQRLGGQYNLIVETNSNGAIDDYPNDNDNLLVQPITPNPEPPADLVTGTNPQVSRRSGIYGSSA